MLKWYEQVKMEPGKYYVSNRIRLARNWSEYHFPRRLRNDEASEMVQRMRDALQELPMCETVSSRKFRRFAVWPCASAVY